MYNITNRIISTKHKGQIICIEEANGVIVITINNNLIPNLGVGRNSECPGEELGIAMDIAMSIINAIYPDAQP